MSAANKARGTRWENDIADHVNATGLRARRLQRTGVKDIGDVEIAVGDTVIVVEAKNEKRINLPGYLKEADIEASHYAAKYKADNVHGVAVVKRRNHGVGTAYAVMELDEFLNLIQSLTSHGE